MQSDVTNQMHDNIGTLYIGPQFEKQLGAPKAYSYAPPTNASASGFTDHAEGDTLIRVASAIKIGEEDGREDGRGPRPNSSSGWESSNRSMPSFTSTQQCLLVVGFLTAVVTVPIIVIIADSVHTIEEGNVGIYYVQVNSYLL